MRQSRSSRRRFQKYRQEVKARAAEPNAQRDPAVPIDEREARRLRPRSRTFFELFKAFLGIVEPHKWMVAATLVALTLATLIGLIPLYIPKLVIDNVLGNHPLPPWLPSWLQVADDPDRLLAMLALTAVGITCVAISIGLWGRWHTTRVAKRLQVETRREVFEHASRLPLHRVYELKSGGLASILREDAGAVGDLLFGMLYNPWRAITQLIGSLIILAWVDWRLLVGAMGILPIIWYTHRMWISRIRPMWRDVRVTRRGVDAHATEAFGGMRVVRGFGRQHGEAGTFVRNNNMMIRQELFTWWWMRGVETAWAFLIPAASAALLWYGGSRILADQAAVAAETLDPSRALTIGDLVLFLSYLAALLGPIESLAATANNLQNSLAGLDRILDMLREPREMPSPPDAVQLRKHEVSGRVELDNVWFQYPAAKEAAVRGISFTAEPGEVIALVGISGAGKTTLCNLVARFYDPTDGAIRLDGTDLRQIDVESYRRILGIVEQDIFLFDGSVADNIGYGRRNATRDEIIRAGKLANAHEFIVDLADGYDTWVGERGVKLSGGQRQRLAIARAILADPKILILDEATSNLDTESERLIQGSLRALMHQRTSFVIAHRLSTIRDASKILVLEHGQVLEMGRHDELMERSGRYREMVLLQTQALDDTSPAEQWEDRLT
jgi:ATP-binding cassette subfamily B protein